ncbi:hypothetical protein [Deinococcus aquaticus]|uniref:Uncharacterized protein n=1 Tax=Deinococcus aquaticus TaxID=328692 RepID=A0ABY7V3L2_9DEIO|nr:hypothetical protein [Deinococcus aquaticus]WDA59789.1 hypothetical protein M8445_06205 [Deinococcus aquaticus]
MTDTAPATPPTHTPLSWRALETRVGLDDLPAFHRAFLTWRGIEDAAGMPLRRVQQRVEAELNRLVQAGHATRSGEDWHLTPDALSGFPQAQPFLT